MTPHLNTSPGTFALPPQAMAPIIDLDQEQLDPRLAAVLPRDLAERHRLVPIRLEGERLVVAVAAPVTLATLEVARLASGRAEVLGVVASGGALARALDRLYGSSFASLATTQPLNEDELNRALAARRAKRPVVLYGWSELLAEHLAQTLARAGLRTRLLTPSQMGFLHAEDVVIAPIPAIEALTRKGQEVRYRLIAAGKTPDFDLPRAHALGAKSFLVTPIDPQLLLRAVRRCQAEHAPLGLEAHGAA